MTERKRYQQTPPLQERLTLEAERLRTRAKTMRLGKARETLLRRAREFEVTAALDASIRGQPIKTSLK